MDFTHYISVSNYTQLLHIHVYNYKSVCTPFSLRPVIWQSSISMQFQIPNGWDYVFNLSAPLINWLYKNRVHILNLKVLASFPIQKMSSLYQGLNWEPSDPKADNTPMCHCASLLIKTLFLNLFFEHILHTLIWPILKDQVM